MPDVEVTVTTNPIDVYINSDPTVFVNTATQGIQGPTADSGLFLPRSETGIFVGRSETGLFYPYSNPLNFVTSSQLNDVDINNAQLRRDVVYITGDQRISGLKSFDNTNFHGLYADGNSLLSRKYTLITAPGLFVLYNFTGASGIRTTGISFLNDRSFNIYGSGQSAIKLYEKLITGFDNINSRNFISDYNGYFGWFNPSLPAKSSRFTSKDGGGYWVTLDRADGTPENLNIAGNLQVGSGSGIQAQRLYVRGNALITADLTVNTSGNFVSGLFVNRNPVLTGTSGIQSQINNLSISSNDSTIVRTTGNQSISGNKNFLDETNFNTINVTGGGLYAGTNVGFALDTNSLIISDSLLQYGINFQDGFSFDLNGPSGNIDLYNGTINGFANIYQNSNRVIDESQTGIFATKVDFNNFTGDLLDLNVKIDSISGFFDLSINNLSGYSESTYATKTEVIALNEIVTGNNYSLTEMINSLSGYVGLNFATSFNLNQTGQLLSDQINSLSGAVTGSYATKQYVVDSINTLSGNLTFVNYKYTLTAGYDEYEIMFPQSFIQPPRTVMVQMENEQYNIIYAYDVYGITASGFNVKFSDILAEENKIMVLAKA